MRRRDERIDMELMRLLGGMDRSSAAGASKLAAQLEDAGWHIQPRTVRLRLLELDRRGWTELVSRRLGRRLTAAGRQAIERSDTARRLGFVGHRMDEMICRMDYDPARDEGTLPVCTALFAANDLARAMLHLEPLFARLPADSARMAFAGGGDILCGRPVDADSFGLATLSAVSFSALLLKQGLPVTLRYGSLLEMRHGRASRMAELMEYRGATVDPIELFIRAGLTRVQDFARTGDGLIGAGCVECPAIALDRVRALHQQLRRNNLSPLIEIGRPGQPLLDIPAQPGRAILLLHSGLNPYGALHEAGIPFQLDAFAGLEEARALIPVREVLARGRRQTPWID